MSDPSTGPGTTDDSNQANKTGLPDQPSETPDVSPTEPGDGAAHPDADDPTSGPGTTSDPNQANRT